jgi:ferrous iron transport protein B
MHLDSGAVGLKKIVIVGSANVGKTVLFNKFSKSYSIVSNYSQTTYSLVRKEADFAGEKCEIVDTPGVFSLNVLSDDERSTRDILVYERPELVIFCADAVNLKKSLILLGQVLELGIPTLFCLNKIDAAEQRGIETDISRLSEELGMPIIITATIHGIGLGELEKASVEAKPVNPGIIYPQAVEKIVTELATKFPPRNKPHKGLLLLAMNSPETYPDFLENGYGKDVVQSASGIIEKRFQEVSGITARKNIFETRQRWAEKIASRVTKINAGNGLNRFADTAANISRHPVWGWPILFLILWLIFKGVGTGATAIAAFLDIWIFIPAAEVVSDLVSNQLFEDFLVGDFGILTMGVANAIGTVVPILFIFFMILNFLEDVGYLPNLSILINRLLRPFGLSGKAVLPMVLGFGCNTMATLTTRMLESRKERIIATFLIALGFPCAVQLGVMLAIFSTAPFSALLIVIGSVAATQVFFGIILARLVPTEKKPDFIIELPAFKLPGMRNIFKKTYFRIKWFLIEALPMFMIAAVMMFVLNITGLLALIRSGLKPVVTGFLYLPEKVAEVFILVVSRREVGAVYFKEMVDAGELDYYQIVVGLVVITLFIPCASNTIVMIKELGARWAVAMNIAIIVIAVLVGGIVNYFIRQV